MALSLKTHEVKVSGSRATVARVRPYVRLRSGDNPPVFVQGGAFYTEDGKELKSKPSWLDAEVAKLSDATKEEVGLTKPTGTVPNRDSTGAKS